ncbi:MAG: TlpA disulfide reductase family protein [Chitinophagales bacterium]
MLTLLPVMTGCITGKTPVIGIHSGELAPEIKAEGISGDTIALSSLRGKYVLVEFWDSGNDPARRSHFEMQRVYEKYKNASFKDGSKGYAVFSISLDAKKEQWKDAVQTDHVQWPEQAIDTRGWNAPAVVTYNVASLPKYYLIDGDGVIVYHNILIDELEEKLKEEIN